MSIKAISFTDENSNKCLPESGQLVLDSINRIHTGYYKSADGLLIQWGTKETTTQSNKVTFPVSFLYIPTVLASTGAGNYRTPVYCEDVLPSSFTLFLQPHNTNNIWLNWFAIGRWK